MQESCKREATHISGSRMLAALEKSQSEIQCCTDAADVFLAVIGTEAQIAAEPVAHVVAVE